MRPAARLQAADGLPAAADDAAHDPGWARHLPNGLAPGRQTATLADQHLVHQRLAHLHCRSLPNQVHRLLLGARLVVDLHTDARPALQLLDRHAGLADDAAHLRTKQGTRMGTRM